LDATSKEQSQMYEHVMKLLEFLLVGETTSGGSDTNCWGFLLPMRNGGVHDHCPKETKHTNTIFNVVRQITYIHGRDQYY
jgi:hypothetical protein